MPKKPIVRFVRIPAVHNDAADTFQCNRGTNDFWIGTLVKYTYPVKGYVFEPKLSWYPVEELAEIARYLKALNK